jgi:deoxyribodipyrimidine photo-lyase
VKASAAGLRLQPGFAIENPRAARSALDTFAVDHTVKPLGERGQLHVGARAGSRLSIAVDFRAPGGETAVPIPPRCH